MALNPLELIKMKGRLDLFSRQHPRFRMFLHELGEKAMVPGTILEIKATTPDGKEYVTNIKLTEDDVQTFDTAKTLKG